MEQKTYWNSVAGSKQFTTPFQSEAFARFVEKDATILDVGCGYGRTLNELSELGYSHLLGIDFSEGMIKRGKSEFPHYQKFQEQYGIYGVFELPEGALVRHHNEEWLKTLFNPFDELDYKRLTFTTMNGHTSNVFYFIGRVAS